MRFTDEKIMWSTSTEAMAHLLANKTEREVMEVLDNHDVIQLRSSDRPKATFINRLALMIFYVPLVFLACIKWWLTGDFYLDSWAKRSRALNALIDFICI